MNRGAVSHHQHHHVPAAATNQQVIQKQQQHQQQLMMENEAAALAAEMFDHFCAATTMRQILGLYRNMCDQIGLRAGPLNDFYPKLKAKVKNWKAAALWKKFDARAAHRVYNKGAACTGTRVLVIGAGPCGLRTAIEAQLLGCKVVVVEKRDRISRNNVLHLWPFVITDLRNLGAKKFYGKFCAGSIDHISIRQLQCILLKVALLLGVEVHEGVSFSRTIDPKDGCGWRALVSPEDHAVSHYEFDVLIGADGKRNTLEGFKRKEFRGKLAIAITANFINKRTEAEAKAEEISGVAFIFNQSFFKELYHTTGIDLENIVYYKDETHYFVMTAKKHSLIDKGVIMHDYADPAELLSTANVNTQRLLDYAREAAEFSTKYQMPNLEFAVNHYGKPDVAMFDFTSMFAADNSSRVLVRNNCRLLKCLVGDSLLEPFWPTGSGCARGFLSSMDAAYAVKLFANTNNSMLGVLAQRESIYRLLGQTTPENLHRDIGSYTLDPATRYPNLNRTSVNVFQVKSLIDSDDPLVLEQTHMDTNLLQQIPEPQVRRKRRTGDTTPLGAILLRWIKSQLKSHDFVDQLHEVEQCFTTGRVLCALINRYRPDLVDAAALKEYGPEEGNRLAFDLIDQELNIPRIMSAKESLNLDGVDRKMWLTYLEQICEVFRGEIPHVKHAKLDFSEFKENKMNVPDFSKLLRYRGGNDLKLTAGSSSRTGLGGGGGSGAVIGAGIAPEEDRYNKNRSKRSTDMQQLQPPLHQQQQLQNEPRRAKKRRSHEKFHNIEERTKRLQEIQANRTERQNKRRLQRQLQTQNFYKSLHMLQANMYLRNNETTSSPFEDYSLFMYKQSAPDFNNRVKDLEQKLLYPDRERGLPLAYPRGGADEQFNDRIKSMENKIAAKPTGITDKKPKDLLRAIGKIESNDWNVREIEKKIEASKKTEVGKSREKVPKWSREQFLARQNKMNRPVERQESVDDKFKEIDSTIKNLDKQLKEGHNLDTGERGKNKVASIAGQFVKKDDSPEEGRGLVKSNSKVGLVFSSKGVSEVCHFCREKVYLMEKISAEGLVLHRSCLKCVHCHTNLRLGGYAFDRDSPDGLFYCTQHFRLPLKTAKPSSKQPRLMNRDEIDIKKQQGHSHAQEQLNELPQSLEIRKMRATEDVIAMHHLMERGQTPERIEFENADALSDGEHSEEHIIDENEWTDRNFGTETEDSDSDFSSTDSTDSDSDSDIYEEATDSPLGVQTLQLANDWIGKQKVSMRDSDDDDSYDSSDDDDADSQTEGEDQARAREIRMQEVKLNPPVYTTDTETEVQTDTESSSPEEREHNSATEISTDSEFDQDPRSSLAVANSQHGHHHGRSQRVSVRQAVFGNNQKSGTVHLTEREQNRLNRNNYELGLELNIQPLVQVDPTVLNPIRRSPLKNPRPGDYLLNKVASTEGIASKKSLELKKRYLLGEPLSSGIMKSDSTSVLDSKFKSFHSNISECQKLLNVKPGVEKTDAEKRSVYGQINFQKATEVVNGDRKEVPQPMSETINTKLVENKLKECGDQSVSLKSNNSSATYKKDSSSTPIVDLTEEILKSNEDYIKSLDKEIKSNSSQQLITIDLTGGDSPDEDCEHTVHDRVTVKREEQTAPQINNSINDLERSPSRPYEQPVVPKTMLWDTDKGTGQKHKEVSDVESDSLSRSSSSSSSSSSLNDIPHFILDSATSPDTQNLMTNKESEFEAKLKSIRGDDELMQIDSLMIVDGKYVGDPEDLQLLEQLPEGTIVEPAVARPATKRGAEMKYTECFVRKDLNALNTNTTNLDYLNKNRPNLKFDTKNENKVDTLKNLPMSPPKAADSNAVGKKAIPIQPASRRVINDAGSDSETDVTGQAFTETEVSDWAADDAVSENFVDLEFALNSNKGTIKRNKKAKHKKKDLKTPEPGKEVVSSNGLEKEVSVEKKVECNIMKNLGVENIEFMDTGSDDSCAETYSTTNKAMLKNRGYVEFVEPFSQQNQQSVSLFRNTSSASLVQNKANFEVPKEEPMKEIPGIDYVEQGACILSGDYNELKTPVNEVPKMMFANMSLKFSGMRQPSNESINDIEQDSLLIVDNVKEVPARYDAEAKTPQNQYSMSIFGDIKPARNYQEPEKSRKKSKENLFEGDPKNADEMSYEEYVRQLQNEITQISNARDSIDVRKAKRKSSKGDLTGAGSTTTVNEVPTQEKLSPVLSIFDEKITQPPTLTKKLEELTKERDKQKDLIHDLVMNKLQTKKQMNAEKRLNRNRNRQIGSLSPALPTSPLSQLVAVPPPGNEKVVAIAKTRDLDDDGVKKLDPGTEIRRQSRLLETPVRGSSMPTDQQQHCNSAEKGVMNKENLPLNDSGKITPKITKTQSFCVYSNRFKPTVASRQLDDNYVFSTPLKSDHVRADPETEKMRTEARARARMKTNEELGLSPDEKILQLRRRYHLEKQQQSPFLDFLGTNKSDDVKVKERSIMASKSVNDIRNEKLVMSELSGFKEDHDQGVVTVIEGGRRNGEIQADLNLIEAATSMEAVPIKPRRGRNKDPERRKSLIQAVSDFFHKKRDSPATGSAMNNSSQSSGGGIGTMAGAKEKMDTIFNRFKISPSKFKDKTRSCPDLLGSEDWDLVDDEKSYCERSKSENCLKIDTIDGSKMVNSISIGGGANVAVGVVGSSAAFDTILGSPSHVVSTTSSTDLLDECPPPVPPLPLNYQRSDDELSYSNDREMKRLKAMTKASRQGELKRLRIAQEIQREQEEIEVQIKELEARGVHIEKTLRGEEPSLDMGNVGANDEKLLKDLLEIWRNITQLKKRDEELTIRQQELQLEHRHAQLKEQLNLRLSTSKLDKSSADVAAEGAILNEMLEIVAKRAALRPTDTMTAAAGGSMGADDM